LKDRNPHHLCTWDDQADCAGCPEQGVLHCKWDRRLLTAFLVLFLPFGFCAFFGMALVWKISGAWWYLAAYGAFCIFFFVFFEIRILCSHCPFYGEDSRILHCLANHGIIKLWRYHPEPMNRFERVSLVVCFVFFGLFPVFANACGIWYISNNYDSYGQVALLGMIGITAATLFTIIAFFAALQIYVCPKCINFSCPLNGVPKPEVDDYLARNPVMREAWEKRGYQLGG
jgi:hypothetical protein